MLSADKTVAKFDSASAMLAATAAALRDRPFPRLGGSRRQAAGVRAAGRLPLRLRQVAYTRAGAAEAVPVRRLAEVDTEAQARWVAGHYPGGPYPAVVLGSSNGAVVHLAALLGAPFLPQTLLVPVRWAGNDPAGPAAAAEWGARVAAPLLARNPDVVLHHMHDGNQDRLMVSRMAYFRLKRLRLGPAWERFLGERLAPGAPVLVLDDRSAWPTTRIGDRHVFQTGARGGLTPEEVLRDAAAPEPDGRSPEAEWGFEPALGADVRRWADRAGHPVHRLVLDEPEALSGPVADLHRRLAADRGAAAERLVVESFILLDPYHVARSAAVPFWTVFPVRPSLDSLRRYLDRVPAYDEVRVLLFNHGVRSAGLAGADEWAEVARSGARHGAGLAGVDPGRYPADFGALARYGDVFAALPDAPAPPRRATAAEVLDALAAAPRPGVRIDMQFSSPDGG